MNKKIGVGALILIVIILSVVVAVHLSSHHEEAAAVAVPSKQAKMVCASEAHEDIDEALDVSAKSVTTPVWKNAIYSCRYLYSDATITLSVYELPNKSETTHTFDMLGKKLGNEEALSIGQGGFQTTNGSVVVRKDFKVLLVDISGVPKQFGPSAMSRSDVALSVATTIMGCWSGK